MAERFVRSHIAQCVANFLGSREQRAHLETHGWLQGMPIIMAHADEPLEDVMGLVALEEGPALVATIDPASLFLRFLHVSTPTAALKDVDTYPAGTEVWALFVQAARKGIATFRTSYTPHSAVAHLLPTHETQQAINVPGRRDPATKP